MTRLVLETRTGRRMCSSSTTAWYHHYYREIVFYASPRGGNLHYTLPDAARITSGHTDSRNRVEGFSL
ncbi:unnamed protein product [Boreogadus saida]